MPVVPTRHAETLCNDPDSAGKVIRHRPCVAIVLPKLMCMVYGILFVISLCYLQYCCFVYTNTRRHSYASGVVSNRDKPTCTGQYKSRFSLTALSNVVVYWVMMGTLKQQASPPIYFHYIFTPTRSTIRQPCTKSIMMSHKPSRGLSFAYLMYRLPGC